MFCIIFFLLPGIYTHYDSNFIYLVWSISFFLCDFISKVKFECSLLKEEKMEKEEEKKREKKEKQQLGLEVGSTSQGACQQG